MMHAAEAIHKDTVPMCLTWMMRLQVGAQWAVEQETIQVGSITADFAQPTSEQQVKMHSTARLCASST